MMQKVHGFVHPLSLGPAFISLGPSSIYSDSCGYMQLTYPNDSDQNVLLLSNYLWQDDIIVIALFRIYIVPSLTPSRYIRKQRGKKKKKKKEKKKK
ncbi:hypothetical protein BDV39DRAFT_168025, partial [Aspergillus sergii]